MRVGVGARGSAWQTCRIGFERAAIETHSWCGFGGQVRDVLKGEKFAVVQLIKDPLARENPCRIVLIGPRVSRAAPARVGQPSGLEAGRTAQDVPQQRPDPRGTQQVARVAPDYAPDGPDVLGAGPGHVRDVVAQLGLEGSTRPVSSS